ncbi:MAG: M17 family peptidase N-terminal domain-containing protein, partial [Phycisphaerae bacterium]
MPKSELHVAVAAMGPRLRGDVLIVPMPTPKGRPAVGRVAGVSAHVTARFKDLLANWAGRSEVGAVDHHLLAAGAPFRRIALVSLGTAARPEPEDVRLASALAARWCARHRLRRAVVAADALLKHGEAHLSAWAEAAVLAGYRFDRRRSKRRDNSDKQLKRLTLALSRPPDAALRRAVARSVIIAEAANLARTYGHEPPNVINPVTLAQRVRGEARGVGLRCLVL